MVASQQWGLSVMVVSTRFGCSAGGALMMVRVRVGPVDQSNR